MAIFFSAATAAGAFGGLLARGIMDMRGIAGLGGWQWIFIIEGLITFFVGTLRPDDEQREEGNLTADRGQPSSRTGP